MPFHFRLHTIAFMLGALLIMMCASPRMFAQVDNGFDDEAADPVKLFERGQDAHQKNNLQLALECYTEALKLRPEFPEAEFQKGAALVSLNRLAEAEASFRRAAELRESWALPRINLALLLISANRAGEAEPFLKRALEIDIKNQTALLTLATLRLRAGTARDAAALMRRATEAGEGVTAATWALRGAAERAAGDKASAEVSLEHALKLDPDESTARAERAEMRAEAGDYPGAVEDIGVALKASLPSENARLSLRLARFLLLAGKKDEARRVLEGLTALPSEYTREADALRLELADVGENTAEARAALEKLIERDSRNAALWARLGASYRIADPQKSLDSYRRAVEIEPANVDYATGYAAALVQGRRFEQAAAILRRIVVAAPEHYAAHANLAAALDELKNFREALAEYQWIRVKRPELAITNFFIARAHDMLGEYKDALAAYETFLAKADAQANNLEIEKVKLRLPSLRKQIARGEGRKDQGKDK
ncbi:MAG TPA: tetratricopeptide repeat protein [Pyrinomonadaceae bacterium]|nr:tetratricopeptide repeat protein [Pyrinomonadaceae bacterium]